MGAGGGAAGCAPLMRDIGEREAERDRGERTMLVKPASASSGTWDQRRLP